MILPKDIATIPTVVTLGHGKDERRGSGVIFEDETDRDFCAEWRGKGERESFGYLV
ncbi:uncharacterized protein BT62DRAFT_937439 [Guyanagaster necrorhizus]|uniref:Uncharacterized protein n=1 Tax=Guyanagaster necrorhizus TaxID=856835 RepID=A0A9P8AMY7_9AGAR|nr:uncharacterized protein BT62DRAFT_937439 [Guyanagaster necrorhizus MCA 3950]KAG7441201.1 hypothetical protein BT62DRAFT_937439 [Guyanagaster necrorhizus MCA 3950]